MKIIKKSLISAMLFLIYANNAYATTAGTYVAKENTGVNKIVLLLVGVGLISLVLFLGYKMDKKETQDERSSKANRKERDLDDIYDAVYNSKTDISREIDKIEINDEDLDIIDDDSIYNDDEASLITDELLAEELEKMAIEEAIKEAESQLNESKVSEEEEEIDLTEEEDAEEEIKEVEEVEVGLPKETKVTQSTTVIIDDEDEEYIRNKKSMNSTMVFETEKLRKIEEKLNKVYEYNDDDEDELDLAELESSIKAANIKRYTRKKPKTNKKEKVEKKKDENVKRFTRKKVRQIVEEVIEEVKKPRRGRPTKAEAEEKARIAALNIQKPRRGRPPKKDKPKRGRPPKKVEKAKRGRPAKKK